MEFKDHNGSGKESFTTPGGPFRFPEPGPARQYSFDRAEHPGGSSAVKPQAQEGSPFSAQYAEPRLDRDGTPQAGPEDDAPRPSADSERIYTVRLPQTRQAPPQKQRSLWWVPLAVLAALLLGVGLGLTLEPTLPAAPAVTGETAAPQTALTPAELYQENLQAVVEVVAIPKHNPLVSIYLPATMGTGFLISEDGYLLTNGHVVKDAGQILVRTEAGAEYEARLVASEMERSDLALLKIEATGLQPVKLGSSSSVVVGDWVATIGNPMGELEFSLSTGHISAAPRRINTGVATLSMLQTSAAINKGNSGGPLFDREGRVIGMVTAKYADYSGETALEGLGFALPIDPILELAQIWLQQDRPGT